MATTTPNFGWPVPTSTDLVKDGATAIESLGDSIDASLLDLKGGTSGQVLSKNSNTDMDFTWVTSDDANAIQNAIVDAKGDLIAATAADTPARLAVGTNGQVLQADSTAATGLKWATPSSGGLAVAQITDVNTLSGTSINITGLSSYDFIQFRFSAVAWNTGASWLKWTINNDTSALYQYQRSVFVRNDAVVMPTMAYFGSDTAINNTNSTIPQTNGGGSSRGYVIILQNCKSTGFTTFNLISNWGDSLGTEETTWISGIYKSAAAVSSFQMTTDAGYTFNAGGYTVYGG